MKELKTDALMMKKAILKGDFRQFAHYMSKSWEAKKLTANCVTNARIDAIFDLAIDAGAVAGKVSGAGGDGFIMFIVDAAKQMDVIRALNETEGRVMACHFTKRGTEGWRLY
jgi:D-glycero-alpha-D-manno-heptose-7-phosphate kinase